MKRYKPGMMYKDMDNTYVDYDQVYLCPHCGLTLRGTWGGMGWVYYCGSFGCNGPTCHDCADSGRLWYVHEDGRYRYPSCTCKAGKEREVEREKRRMVHEDLKAEIKAMEECKFCSGSGLWNRLGFLSGLSGQYNQEPRGYRKVRRNSILGTDSQVRCRFGSIQAYFKFDNSLGPEVYGL